MVRYAIARGHTVTLFNRGKTNTHLFPDLEKLRGDRNDDLGAIEAQIAEVHAHIRAELRARFGAAEAERFRLLYGGSVKPANAAGIFAIAWSPGGYRPSWPWSFPTGSGNTWPSVVPRCCSWRGWPT